MVPKTECYIVGYIEGSRGSFIGDLLWLLLADNDSTIISIKPIYGDAGNISRGVAQRFSHLFSFDLLMGYDHGQFNKVNTIIDYKSLSAKYKDWKVIWITATKQEVTEIELINMYKKEYLLPDDPIIDVAYNFYKNNKELQVDGVTKPQFLEDDAFSKFVTAYINHRLTCNLHFHSDIVDIKHNELPEEIKNRFFKLRFSDIMNDMPKVLNLLSEVTGKKITPNIVKSYEKYIMGQILPKKYIDAINTENQRYINE